MAATVFRSGDLVTLTNTFSVNGIATDPTTISLAVTDPAGASTTYTYAAAQITRTGTGVYTKDITCTLVGTWVGVWIGTGTASDIETITWSVWEETPTALYVGLDDLKAYLGITDTVDNLELESALNAACRQIDQLCGRAFYDSGSATARLYTADDATVLYVDDFHTTTGLIVATDEGDDGTYETTWASTDYELHPLSGVVGGVAGWPYRKIVAVDTRTWPRGRRAAVQITARWGWASVPHPIRQAALILATRLFKRKDSAEGVLGFADFGVVRLGRTDPDVAALIGPYRLPGIG